MQYKKLISASVVLYNPNMAELKNVIKSYSPTENRLLYLIDNSPQKTDVTSVLIDNKYIHYYFTGENKGYGAGHNIAIRMALKTNAKYHVVLNPDLEFEPSIIDKIAEFVDLDDDIAQVMPKVLNQQGELQYLCKLLPTPIDLFFKRFLPKKYVEKSLKRYQLKFADYDKQMNIPSLSGCFMFFRVAAFNVVGFFDERFFMYAEDIDMTRRMHKWYKTVYYPDVSIVHIHKAESYKSFKMFKMHIISIFKYFNKWGWFFDNERKTVNANVLKSLGVSCRRAYADHHLRVCR
jgi:GT2 family glycosyltransferase